MFRVCVFSAIYGGISRVKRSHSGAVGKVLAKEMGKEFVVSFPSE
jgi:stress-induced morphogen